MAQLWELRFDIGVFAREKGFGSEAEMEKAWWFFRDRLLAQCRPFHRPAAFWHFEHGYLPCCAANGYESERAALLRLRVMLTPQEKAIFRNEEWKREQPCAPPSAVEPLGRPQSSDVPDGGAL